MIVSRFAPSPTGRLHLGHAYSAVTAHARARAGRGKFLIRIEDLDRSRCRPEFVAGIMQDIAWLGLERDLPLLVQSQRGAHYAAAFDRLRAQRLVFACFCTRADIAEALSAPHGEASAHYPGTCRDRPDNPEKRRSLAHSWRLDAGKALALAGQPGWTEADGTAFASAREDFDDIIVARKDAPAAYHLACVVDDAASGVTLVVRGADLRASTPIQRLLQILLRLPEPRYLHHPLVVHANGRRLAKRDLAPTLGALRAQGVEGRALAKQLRTGFIPGDFRLADA